MSKVKKLTRSTNDKIIAGVAGGVGEYFEVDSTIVRIIFLALIPFGGFGFFLYVAMWLLVPAAGNEKMESGAAVSQNADEIKDSVKKAGDFIKKKVEEVTKEDDAEEAEVKDKK